MKTEMIARTRDVISGKEDLDVLYIMRDFPVYMGVTDDSLENDLFADEKWMISKGSGMIQLNELIPAEILYAKSHNSAIGAMWKKHHEKFADFLYKHKGLRGILEIGGGNGILNKNYVNSYGETSWTIIEPSSVEPLAGCRATYVRKFWKKPFDFSCIQTAYDTLVHTHLIEHQFDIHEFMEINASALNVGGVMLFSMPNMEELLKKKYPYALNFEHTYYISEPYVDLILKKYGFKLIQKEYFEDHSIFYCTQKTDIMDKNPFSNQLMMRNLYEKNQMLFHDYIRYYQERVKDLNQKIFSCNRQIYVFGAHVNTQLLINFGLFIEKIKGVLDNDILKQGHRLYGTKLNVLSPSVLAQESKPVVILVMGAYNREIKEDILRNINADAEFVE